MDHARITCSNFVEKGYLIYLAIGNM